MINKPNSIKSLDAKNNQIPKIKNIKLGVLSLSSIKPIKDGIIMNNVHHPSKKILILVIPKAFNPNIIPIKIKTNPKTYF